MVTQTRPGPGTTPDDETRARPDMPTSSTDDLLAERYGRPGDTRRRPLAVALVLVLAVISVAWVGWSAWSHADDDATGYLVSYTVTSDTSTEVTVQIDRRTGAAVECDVYAQAADHSRVGERMLRIPEGEPGELRLTETITTQRRAVNGVFGTCTAAN
jgi:ABC-type transporter Mla subunit MlaD